MRHTRFYRLGLVGGGSAMIALVALKILFAVAGTAFKLATTLLFTLVPILLVGWLTMRAMSAAWIKCKVPSKRKWRNSHK